MARRPKQLELPTPPTWGGRRKGAGRPKSGRPVGVAHRSRPLHRAAHPVHVTLRAVREVGSLREIRVAVALRDAITVAHKPGFRVVHFSIQSNHVHFIVEGHDRDALTRGVQGLAIRLARAVNRATEHAGRVWGDRYHARALSSPRETRICIVYVLQNHRPRGGRGGAPDPLSSGGYFDGWRDWKPPARDDPPPVRKPRTWLCDKGWRRLGLISLHEAPAS